MINQFQKRWYDRSLIDQQINKTNLQEREQLLKEKKKETSTNIPSLPKYNRTHWHHLHIKQNLAEIFQNPPYFSLPPKQKPQSHYWHQIN